MRQTCGRELIVKACASRPDFADALRNSVPFLAWPPAFDPPHAARSKLQCRFSLTFETRVRAKLDVSFVPIFPVAGSTEENPEPTGLEPVKH
jgi:hypothetical protein